MILQRELAALRAEWALDQSVIEKDYVLGWLLAGIANHEALATTWIFKGGTCLRKCYYETYRFSEDLDFTIVDGGPEEPDELLRIFAEISAWVREESGLELVLDDGSFRRRRNKRGNPTTQGKIGYRGPNASPSMPKVKLDPHCGRATNQSTRRSADQSPLQRYAHSQRGALLFRIRTLR